MVRKSARSAKSKWPCGSCGLQCNDEAILCDDCGSWYHAECECLSAKDFKVLRHLGEEYLCSSCTQTSGGQFDYTKALQRLQNASHIGMLESAVALERILLRNTEGVKARSNELQLGKRKVDVVASEILKKFGECSLCFYHKPGAHAPKSGCILSTC